MRGLLLVAVGGLLWGVEAGPRGWMAVGLLGLFAASNAVLAAAPLRWVAHPRFELVVGAADLVLAGLGTELAMRQAGRVPISLLLMILVVALAQYRAHAAAGATAVGALHTWLALGGPHPPSGAQLALQVLFLCSIGLYYGTLATGVHSERRRLEADALERHELTTLLRILDAITSSLDQRRVSRAIVEHLNAVVPCVRCSLLYVDPDGRRGYVLASHDDPNLDMLELDLRKYPEIRKAIETRQPVIIQDVRRDPLLAGVREHLRSLDFHSIVVVPLTFGEELLGTLCLKTARASHPFTDREIKFITAVARASANALKNALLHRQVLEASERHRALGEKLARILAHAPDPIWTTDPAGKITEVNRGAEKLLGYRRQELLGRDGALLLGPAEPARVAEGLRGSNECRLRSARLRRRDGGDVEVELYVSRLTDDPERGSAVWIGHDLTALKRAQAQLLQAEKLSTIGEVIAGVAHELNNPLSAVLGFSQLLLARSADETQRRYLDRVHEGAVRCQKIVRNLLSFARKHKPERRPAQIHEILEKTLELREYQLRVHGIEVVRDFAENVPQTMLDNHQMQQVFLNLIRNAEQAIVAARRPGRLVLRTRAEQGWIRVEIEDNGTGMPQEILPKIFDPFFTTKEPGEGTGLGLSVSYGIVQEHGGHIQVRSHEGSGSTFVVELPILEAAAEPPAQETPAPALGSGSRRGRLLVVDDEPAVVELLVEVLHAAGFDVDTAADGTRAREKLERASYDAVLTDVRMPHYDGMALYEEICTRRPELRERVIFITGDTVDPKLQEFLAGTGLITLAKPLDIHQIPRIVEEVASRSPV